MLHITKLKKLQEEYLCLLKLLPHGGIELARQYSESGTPLKQVDAEIKSLESEIQKLKERLSAKGVVWSNI